MPVRHTVTVDLDQVTFADLYHFVDRARAAGVSGETVVDVVAPEQIDNEAYMYTLKVELSDQEFLTPVVIDGHRALFYREALSKVLVREDTPEDLNVLSGLADELYGVADRK